MEPPDWAAIPLSILVFGPAPIGANNDAHLVALRHKREELRRVLRDLPAKHTVHFGEDIGDSRLPPPIADNAFLQEESALRDYDLVIVLVYSHGSNVELGQIASRPTFSAKSVLFLDKAHEGGYADEACKAARYFNGEYRQYTYPNDITDCHLVSAALEIVSKVQLVKFLS